MTAKQNNDGHGFVVVVVESVRVVLEVELKVVVRVVVVLVVVVCVAVVRVVVVEVASTNMYGFFAQTSTWSPITPLPRFLASSEIHEVLWPCTKQPSGSPGKTPALRTAPFV